MAQLSTEDQKKITIGLQRYWSVLRTPVALTKIELFDAVKATDAWVDANQASFNAGLPQVAKDNLTAEQKVLIFCAVAAFKVSREFAIKLLGGLD